MGQGDVPTSRGGPLRRRREKRQLERLAHSSEREVTSKATAAHVRVIEDQTAVARSEDLDTPEPDEPVDRPAPSRSGGFHVRAVPIDQPVSD